MIKRFIVVLITTPFVIIFITPVVLLIFAACVLRFWLQILAAGCFVFAAATPVSIAHVYYGYVSGVTTAEAVWYMCGAIIALGWLIGVCIRMALYDGDSETGFSDRVEAYNNKCVQDCGWISSVIWTGYWTYIGKYFSSDYWINEHH